MNVKIVDKKLFWFGVSLAVLMVLLYLISIPVDSGSNYYTTDSLLGIIIGHSLIALSTDIIIIAIIIARSIDVK